MHGKILYRGLKLHRDLLLITLWLLVKWGIFSLVNLLWFLSIPLMFVVAFPFSVKRFARLSWYNLYVLFGTRTDSPSFAWLWPVLVTCFYFKVVVLAIRMSETPMFRCENVPTLIAIKYMGIITSRFHCTLTFIAMVRLLCDGCCIYVADNHGNSI